MSEGTVLHSLLDALYFSSKDNAILNKKIKIKF